jgi:hypothetical protein
MERDMHNLTSRCNCRRELRSFLLRYCSFVSCNEKITQKNKAQNQFETIVVLIRIRYIHVDRVTENRKCSLHVIYEGDLSTRQVRES